jgi:hypothetical protein
VSGSSLNSFYGFEPSLFVIFSEKPANNCFLLLANIDSPPAPNSGLNGTEITRAAVA